jgi:hypothetical protein
MVKDALMGNGLSNVLKNPIQLLEGWLSKVLVNTKIL